MKVFSCVSTISNSSAAASRLESVEFWTRIQTPNQASSGFGGAVPAGRPSQVPLILLVVRVDDARELHLVPELADVDVDALGLGDRADLDLVAAARERDGGGRCEGEQEQDAEGAETHGRGSLCD